MIQSPDTKPRFIKKNIPPESWGAPEFAKAKQHLENFRTCLDVGAHIGLMTLRYAKYFEIVHAFEPLVYEYLETNVEHLSNIVVHRYAVSDTSRTVEMYPNPKNSAGGIIDDEYSEYWIKRRYTDPGAPLSDVEKVPIECVSIDQFGFQEVDLIKVDVEGHIIPVVKGMVQTLTNNTPIVQIEMSAFDHINEQVHEMFTDLGYTKFDEYRAKVVTERFYKKE